MTHPRTPRILPLAAFAALLLAAPGAFAQNRAGTAEVTIFGGGYFGGRFYAGSNAIFSQSVDVSDVGTYGLRVGYNINRWFGLEAGFSRAEATFRSRYHDDGLFGDDSRKLGDLELRHWEGNLVFNIGKRRFVPYVTVGAGATQFRSDVPDFGSDTDTRFTANFGGGMKFWVTPRFALRFDARGRSSYVSTHRCSRTDDVFCRSDSSYYYDDNDRRRWYTSGEATGGLTFAF